MKYSRKKKINIKKILIITLSFIFLFSIGFAVGIKVLKNSNNTIVAGPAENNTPLQGNKDNSPGNTDNQNQATTPGDTNSDKGTPTDSGKNDNSTVTTPNKPVESTTPTDGSPSKKQAFLTFDDGPSSRVTPRILKILDEYNIKATFFVIGKNAKEYPDLIRQENAAGHAIANHTYSHDYKYVYSSTANFLADIEKCNQVLASILGTYDSKLIRFPGGSFGRTAYKTAVTKAGYTYVDWNALNDDAGDPKRATIPAAELVQNLKNSVNSIRPENKNHVVILMHDMGTKTTTADALPEIIEFLISQGYEFSTLK